MLSFHLSPHGRLSLPLLRALSLLAFSPSETTASIKATKKQNAELRRIQKQLSELQLQKAQEDAAAKTSSKVEARHVLVGLKKHYIRIANVGGTVVTDVTTTCDDGPYFYSRDKEPFERLEPGESFDQAVFFAAGSPSKFTITTRWRDADGKDSSRDNIITW